MQNGNARGPFGVYKKGLEETFRLRRGERLGGVGGPVQRNFQREEVVPRPLGVRRALHSGPAGPARSLKPGSGGFGPPVLRGGLGPPGPTGPRLEDNTRGHRSSVPRFLSYIFIGKGGPEGPPN
jgi:hypothetical protein